MAREGFDAFAVAALTPLHRAAFLMAGSHHEAEDLVQDVLARVYVAWPRIEGDPHGYAYRALANAESNRRRWRRRHPEAEEATDGAGPVDRDVSQQVADRVSVTAALQMLPPRQRLIVVLRYFVDLTEEQTASAMGISVGTVKSQHARALPRLRGWLGADGPEPPGLGVVQPAVTSTDRSDRSAS